MACGRVGRKKKKRSTRASPWERTATFSANCGPVTVTSIEGAVLRVEQPLSEIELRRLIKDREAISENLRQKVFRRDGHRCRYCGVVGVDFQIDHVVPVALGGTSRLRNLVVACVTCNQEKGAQEWELPPLSGTRSTSS